MEVDVEMTEGQSSAPIPSTSYDIQTISSSQVMANQSIIPSVTVSLHPLVIMNISEHWTRIRAQKKRKQQGKHYFYICFQESFLLELFPYVVIGALIGKQKGRNIEVMNSFELKFEVVDDEIIILRDYYNTKELQYKQVFSDLDFLGWYTTGEAPIESDIKIHKQICQINECPIMLQLNPTSRNVDVSCLNHEYIFSVEVNFSNHSSNFQLFFTSQ